MALRRIGVILLLLIAGVGWWFWSPSGSTLAAEDLRRDLSRYRIEALPDPLPAGWEAELARVLNQAPTMSIVERGTRETVREMLLGVSWIDPRSVKVELDLPEGMRVRFKPHVPMLRAQRQGEVVALVGRDGVCLSPDFEEGELELVPYLQLTTRVPVPPPGRKFTDPVVQEALRALPEFFSLAGALREHHGLELERIEISPDYPVEASVPPPLMFVTSDQRQIIWGRSEVSNHPIENEVELKARRLASVLEHYPQLRGLRRVRLDFPNVALFDEEGRPIPAPASIR